MPHAIQPRRTVAELLGHSPHVATVFLRHRMACVGCAMAPFDSLAEAAAIYGLDLAAFLTELERLTTHRAGRRGARRSRRTRRSQPGGTRPTRAGR